MNDGLVWNDCNLNAFAEETDGTVWIGTSGGLARFRQLRRQAADIPPTVVFTKLLNGQTDVSGLGNPSIGNHANSLIARYSVLNALNGNEVIFRYRLFIRFRVVSSTSPTIWIPDCSSTIGRPEPWSGTYRQANGSSTCSRTPVAFRRTRPPEGPSP